MTVTGASAPVSMIADALEAGRDGAFRCYNGIVWAALVDAARDARAPAEDALAAADTPLF
jgi:hypothetical protein